VLGSAIGLKVVEDVPYIRGLDKWLGSELNDAAKSYLKDMGAAAASNGAVGLYHAAGLTPEAAELGEALIAEGARTYVIDDAELARVAASYPVMWKNPDALPKHTFIGCPHLSPSQLDEWTEKIGEGLKRSGKAKVRKNTLLCAAPDVLEAFKKTENYARLTGYGVKLTYICPLMYMNNPMCKTRPVATNSNKLRTYTTARYYNDDEILALITHNALGGGRGNG